MKDYELIKQLFITYRKSLFKDKIFKIAFEYVTWANAQYREEKKNKNIKTYDWYLDQFIEAAWDIFPHPYHV
jgi:hypothetical protein